MTTKLIQDNSVSKIAEKYRQEGYIVFIEPEAEDIHKRLRSSNATFNRQKPTYSWISDTRSQ